MRFFPESTLAYAIDYQDRLLPAMSNTDALLERARIFAEGLAVLERPGRYNRCAERGLCRCPGLR